VTTDNASYSTWFGVFAILNYRFAPRFADLPDQRYWRAALPDPLPDGVDLSPSSRQRRSGPEDWVAEKAPGGATWPSRAGGRVLAAQAGRTHADI